MERVAIKSNRTQVTKLINVAKELLNKSENVNELIVARDRIISANDSLVIANDKVVSVLEVNELESQCEKMLEYQDNVCEVLSRLKIEIEHQNQAQNVDIVPSIRSVDMTDSGNNGNVKLHKLELRKFKGELAEWTLFWEQYRTAVHENKSLDVIAKFNYLEQSLQGKAAQTISGLTPSEASYNDAIELLKHEYGNQQRIIDSHVQKLLALTPVKNRMDVVGLRTLYNTTSAISRSLTSLGVNENEYGMMVKSVLINCIPSGMKIEYYKKYPNNEQDKKTIVEQIKILLNYLKLEVESIEIAIPSTHVTLQQHVYKSSDKTRANNEKRTFKSKEFNTAAALLSTVEECLFCNSKEHVTTKCDKLNLTIEQKRDILKENRRCFRCTKPSHNSRFCRSKVNCNNCKYKHETIMCDPNYAKRTKGTNETSSLFTKNHENNELIFLQTAKGYVSKDNDKDSVFIRLIIDGGSQLTYIKQELSRKLGLQILGTRKLAVMPFGSEQKRVPKLYNKVELKLMSQYDNNPISITAIEVPEICYDSFQTPNIKHPLIITMNMADISIGNVKQEEGIGLLVGADNYWKLATGEFIRLSEDLTALNTKLGWTLQGPTIDDNLNVNTNMVGTLHVQVIEEEELDMKKFWELETIGINDKETQKDYTNEFIKNKIAIKENRYEVMLPWKNECHLDDNFQGASARMKNLTCNLSKNSKLLEYDKAVRELIESGFAEEVPSDCSSIKTYYMPHRAVYREDKTSSQLRVVFDASSHAPNLPSLNDLLYAGENLIKDLLNILINFRVGKIAMIADIEKAFLQIMISERDRDYHRFLWYKYAINDTSSLPEMQKYRMTRVTFGVRSSPFLLSATLKKLFTESNQFAETAQRLLNGFYVDDLILTENSVNNAIKLYNESKNILINAGMNLRKWNTNHPELRDYLRKKESENNATLYPKVLGLRWDTTNDDLHIDLNSITSFIEKNQSCTKRNLSRAIGRIYDPLCLLGPITITAKILLQQIWKSKIDWDIELPMEHNVKWKKWCCDINKLNEVVIPRNVTINDKSKFELHIFSDASQTAYGAAAYVREILDNDVASVNLLIAKNRVAPLKGNNEQVDLSLPKLELTAALCASRLKDYIVKNVNIKFESVNMWTDSKITLYWIIGDASKWKTYVYNRVQEIQKLTIKDSVWRHCIGKNNPADLLTRGVCANELIKCENWLKGPDFLLCSNNEWSSEDNIDISVKEHITLCALNANNIKETLCVVKPIFSLDNYEQLQKCLRITAYVKRVFKKFKNSSLVITAAEVKEAEVYWFKYEQQIFKQEIDDFIKNGTVGKNSTIYKLTPFLDEKGLLRIRSRLQESELGYDTVNPIILPKNSKLVEKIIWKTHNSCFHSGVNLTLSEIRKRFWIIRGRQKIKSLISKCVICKKLRCKPGQQPFAPLPRDRILTSNPFDTTGVDFAGPLYVLNENNEKRKSYLMLLTCAVTRAVHLELVLDITTESCIRGLRRFISRRGTPTTIYSDNAKTFKRASLEINKLYENLTTEDSLTFATNHRFTWKFIVERAAWWGGFWERMIKTVKDCLKFSLGRSMVNIEELRTIFTEVEAIVNSRPLTYIDDDKDNLSILSPSIFLLGSQNNCSLPSPNINLKRDIILKKWKERQQILEKFWKRWTTEYVQQLRTAHQNSWSATTTFKVDDLVLLHEQGNTRLNWKMVKITQVFQGRDGKIRACQIQLPNKTLLKRPIQLLYPLEVPIGPREDVENIPTNPTTEETTSYGEREVRDRLRDGSASCVETESNE